MQDLTPNVGHKFIVGAAFHSSQVQTIWSKLCRALAPTVSMSASTIPRDPFLMQSCKISPSVLALHYAARPVLPRNLASRTSVTVSGDKSLPHALVCKTFSFLTTPRPLQCGTAAFRPMDA